MLSVEPVICRLPLNLVNPVVFSNMNLGSPPNAPPSLNWISPGEPPGVPPPPPSVGK